jgi:hypothetical protein
MLDSSAFTDKALTVLFAIVTSTSLFILLMSVPLSFLSLLPRLLFIHWLATIPSQIVLICYVPSCLQCLFHLGEKKYAHSLSVVNAANPMLFNVLTGDQTKLAKAKLSQPITDSVNTDDLCVFDLNIAKFLCVVWIAFHVFSSNSFFFAL